ncbi:RNA-binding KH domain-containing protein RCF3-like [Salvia miltiorrhiza]|uniref:RNA-binding KH domain-containing protein RCF3-like n=1 Tax=Salvia miltiorrhiza TaxID=226208 RepID=UPI0025ABB051|nr:RNA-binding KH domain-containing protein RCF3-like [Salvia miltiorrhiza]XP_057809586.1 RNA-binding KH domain-containing protein RCF3-like [Salvia miltiorrhiza]
MEGNRRTFLNKHSNPQFKKTAGLRKGKQYNSIREEFSENFHSSDTVYRILCQSKKIGSVIGKGGNIVKALREETEAKITVSDSVIGSDERVILICSPSDKQAKRQTACNDRQVERDVVEPHCAAQDALLKVHDRIIEEDLGGPEKNNRSETVVSARLLVSNNLVGCLLGRKGDVIQRLRSETGANIRVLPADHLPACATSNDELVQISGKPAVVKKALYEISTLLHQNPWKDKPSLSYPTNYAGQEFHPSGPPMRAMLPPENPHWLEHTMDAHRMHPMPFKGGYGLLPEDLDGVAPHDREAPCEFTIKILCSAERIGSVIGKGGSNVKQLEQETGASIHVENASKESDERVIRVSSIEALWDQRSHTIDAILHLQNKTSEYSDDGTITTRLLVPSSKVGCILGQGGHVISDMRRRTHADIRVFSKKEKPKCASEDEELVQISGSFGIAKDALVEIASRLRTRCLRDVNARGETASVRPLPGFGPPDNFRGAGLPLSSTTIAGSSGRYEHIQDSVREFDSPRFPLPTRATGYMDFNEARISSLSGSAGSRISEFAATRGRHQDPYSTGPDFGASENYSSSRYIYQRPSSSAAPNNYPPPGGYQGYESEHGMYPNHNVSPSPYRSSDRWTAAHHNSYTQQDPYQSIRGHGSYY